MGQDSGERKVEELLHFGVKGMKWGVRRNRSAVKVSVTQKPGSKRLRARGGQNQPASSEAIVTKGLGQVAKKSGFQALTNKELQTYNNRLNLEQNARRLDYQNKNAAQKFVANLLGRAGKRAANEAADQAASQAVKKLMARGAVTAAAAAV